MQANKKIMLREIEIEDSDRDNKYQVYIAGGNKNGINPGYKLQVDVNSESIINNVESYPLIFNQNEKRRVGIHDFSSSENLKQDILGNPYKYQVIVENEGKIYHKLFEELNIKPVHRSNA